MEKAEIHGVPVFKNVDVIARMNSTETIKQAVAGGPGNFHPCPGWLPGEKGRNPPDKVSEDRRPGQKWTFTWYTARIYALSR